MAAIHMIDRNSFYIFDNIYEPQAFMLTCF